MRRLAIAVLSIIEAAVTCAIFASSLELARDLQRSQTVERVAASVVRTVVASTRRIAFAVTIRLRD
jgi:hypothetical protein